jgi:hypothetical protein
MKLPVTGGAELDLRAKFAVSGARYQVMGSEPKGLALAEFADFGVV